MANKWAKLADKLPSAKKGGDGCPLCAGKVLYRGFTALECATFGCDNGPKEDPLADLKKQLEAEASQYGWLPYPWTP